MPLGKWSLSHFMDFGPGWKDFDGFKVCQDFAKYAELRETVIDLLLGRDTNKRRTDLSFTSCCIFWLSPAFSLGLR